MKLSFWFYGIALLMGFLMGIAMLEYTPNERINLMLLWIVWCGLPFLGTCVSGVLMFKRRQAPWLLRFTPQSHWQIDLQQQRLLWFKLHQLWCLVGVGILIAFLLLLLFTDLAFGWSSTLINDPQHLASLVKLISFHWQAYWPAAVPDQTLIEATRFVRISPSVNGTTNAGDWWPFIIASLITYNLLPRCMLMVVCLVLLKQAEGESLAIPPLAVPLSPTPESIRLNPVDTELQQQSLALWTQAQIVQWELSSPLAEGVTLGLADWQEDQQRWQALLTMSPKQLLWQVDLWRSPIAELSDKITEARARGIQQAIRVMLPSTSYPSHLLLSWQRFAQQHDLIWVSQ